MISKLYKNEPGLLRYWEAWDNAGKITVHWGIVGEEGTTNVLDLPPEENAASLIEREAAPLRDQGYVEIDDDKLHQVVIQYPILDMGIEADLNRRYEVESLMNHRLGWRGLGHCDGGDIGSGTMNIFCFVVDADRATQCIVEDLKLHGLLPGARILLFTEEHEQQLFPVESLKHLQ